MRFRTLVGWVFLLAVLGYIGYSAVFAVSNYFQVTEVVDSAVSEVTRRYRATALTRGTDPGAHEYVQEVRAAILTSARRNDLRLDERRVTVSLEGNAVRVKLNWNYPVLTWGGENIVAFPLWIDRMIDRK